MTLFRTNFRNILTLIFMFIYRRIFALGEWVISYLRGVGGGVIYFAKAIRECFIPPFRFGLIIQQLNFIGNQSFVIIVLTSFFTGAVFSIQSGIVFALFQAEGLIGAATGRALAREIAPLMTAFLITGRVGSTIAAELASMKVNEQIDAMESMAVDPISYLVAPRVIGMFIVLPLLCGVFMFFGMLGSLFIGLIVFSVDEGVFFEKLTFIIQPKDIIAGLEKSLAFGLIISTMSCYFGLAARGGAKGVGLATKNSVVNISLMILFCDLILTYVQVNLK